MYKHNCLSLACETGLIRRTVSAIEDFIDCLINFSSSNIDDFANLLWECLTKTTFQVLEDDSEGNEDACVSPIVDCISLDCNQDLRAKLVFVAADVMSFKPAKCIDSIETLRRWLDAKRADHVEETYPNTRQILDKLPPFTGFVQVIKEKEIVKTPVGKNVLLVVKFFARSRAGSQEYAFRSVAGFKASFAFEAAEKSTNLKRTFESCYGFAVGMDRELYDLIIDRMIEVYQQKDWGACVTSIIEYECMLREVLKQEGHMSIVKTYALGQKTSVKAKEKTVEKRAPEKKFKLREAIELKVSEILSIDKMLEMADGISKDQPMFINIFVGLLDDRVKNILKELENEKRIADVGMYNQSRYKHNVVSKCKRKYCKRIVLMKLAGKRYDYALEHYEAIEKLEGQKRYKPKTEEKDKMLVKLDAYTVLRQTRDRFTLRNLEDVEIRQSYQDFYTKILCKHVDEIKNFYNQETWIITLTMEEALSALNVYLGVTRLLKRVEKGKKRGQYIDKDVIKITGQTSRRYHNLDEIRTDFATASEREEAMTKMEYESLSAEDILRNVIAQIYNVSTTRTTTKSELRTLSKMLEVALDKL